MREHAKDVRKRVSELKIIHEPTQAEPNYKKTAGMLLIACREFYEDPENEKAFLAWKAERKGKSA